RLQQIATAVPEPDGCTEGSPVSRLRRLPKSNGLPEAGRCRYFCNASGISVGTLHLRHSEELECLYGKAANGGWSNEQAHVCTRTGSGSQEPESGSRADVASQPGDAGTGRPRP